jgi:arylsulfatase A-like enzyme
MPAARPQIPPIGAERPNVLIVITDDQRQGLDVMDSLRTQLQRRGRSYPNAYVTNPACCPSRASIMTGRYSHNHRVKTNFDQGKLDHRDTLQFYLQRNGYRTGYVGKFLNQWPLGQGPPFFHDWSLSSPSPKDSKARYYGGKVNVDGAIRTVPQYSTDFFGAQATKLLNRYERQDKRPWLLYVSPSAPHPPLIPARRYVNARVSPWSGNPGTREKDLSDKPSWVRNAESSKKSPQLMRALQYRMLMSVDDMAQRILTTLGELREYKDTLVFFISDNGYAWGEHGLTGKFIPYTEATHVPLLIRWPNHIEPGSNDNRLVANIDIAPTILQAAGVVPDGAAIDGKSLLDDTWTRTRLLLEGWKHSYADSPDWASTLTGSTQYTEYYSDNGGIASQEYYDLAQDRYQLRNLLGDDNSLNDPPAVPVMSLQLEQDRQCSGANCP